MNANVAGVIAIVRLPMQPPEEVLEALLTGGLRNVEVTLNTPRALDTIRLWSASNEAMVGAGTVRTAADARRAIEAGARFLVTPTLVPDVLRQAQEARVPVVCGALSASEVDSAWHHGASAVKVFPIDAVGGPRYIAALRGPLQDVPLVPTGGVHPGLTREYADLGCAGVGVGSALVSPDIVRAQRWAVLRQRAAQFGRAWIGGTDG